MEALKASRNIQDLVFGPYVSRRLGVSLGVNPLPQGARFCNFDCIYCECSNGSWPLQWDLRPRMPTAKEIQQELAAHAEEFGDEDLDSITIAGNGEPTLAPNIDEIVDVVNEARDRDWPQARTVILTNGTMCHKGSVRSALAKLDERIVKLDAGTNWILEQMNRPAGKLSMTELVHRIAMVPDVTIQSMFVHGPVDNTSPKEIEVWTEYLRQFKPRSVQIYSLDRVPAMPWVREVPRRELESIAAYVESQTRIPAHVF